MKHKIYISPWMPIGASLILITVVGFLGVINYNLDKEQMGTLLKEKGAALIRSFEAGKRTGMMGKMIPSPSNGVVTSKLILDSKASSDQWI